MLATSLLIPLLVGVLSPLLTAVVQQPHWSRRVRVGVAVAASLVLGALTCLANGTLGHGQNVLQTVLVVLVSAQTAYESLWQPMGWAQAIEVATSRVRQSPLGDVSLIHVAEAATQKAAPQVTEALRRVEAVVPSAAGVTVGAAVTAVAAQVEKVVPADEPAPAVVAAPVAVTATPVSGDAPAAA